MANSIHWVENSMGMAGLKVLERKMSLLNDYHILGAALDPSLRQELLDTLGHEKVVEVYIFSKI